MKIIDFHQHLWIGASPSGYIKGEGVDGFVKGMDKNNVEKAVVHAIPHSLYCHIGDNDDVLKAMKKYPDRIIGSVYLNPKDVTRSLENLNRYFNEGFRCVKLLPYVEGIYIDDPAYLPVFEKIDELKIPVMIHMGAGGGRPNTGVVTPIDYKVGHPMHLGNLAARFPKTKFVIAHMAFNYWWDALMLTYYYSNIYIETSMTLDTTFRYNFMLDHEKNSSKDSMYMLNRRPRVMFGLDLESVEYEKYINGWKRFFEESGKTQFMEDYFYNIAAEVLGIDI